MTTAGKVFLVGPQYSRLFYDDSSARSSQSLSCLNIRTMAFSRHEYTIDGNDFSTLEEFYDVIGAVLIPNSKWGRDLDALNDVLRGGFGTPDNGFRIRWVNSDKSRQSLGYAETVRQLEKRLLKCHPSHRTDFAAQLRDAQNKTGPTVFDWLIEIIRDHGDGGSEAEDNVELYLE